MAILFAFATFILWLIVTIVQKSFIEDLFYEGRSKTFRRKAKKAKSKKENLTLSYIFVSDCNAYIKMNVLLYWFCFPYCIIFPVMSALVSLEAISSEIYRYFILPFWLVAGFIVLQGWIRTFVLKKR
ncbi:MAG: hypothetical protein IJE28_01770 [Oscillospiraceae bacterium]|nr:hypothetical protein [Oscillospiraceae bacterium]MBQ4642642.1 hypothetical protein [Oscillospiraceae bacterium]